MSWVPVVDLFFLRCSLGCQEPQELMGKYRARRGKGENKVMSQPRLLVYWLSVCSGFRVLLDALQHQVDGHHAVLLAPWSWESRHAFFWGFIRDTLVDAFAAADLDEPFLQQQLWADFFKPLTRVTSFHCSHLQNHEVRFSSPPEGNYRARKLPATFQELQHYLTSPAGSLQGGEWGNRGVPHAQVISLYHLQPRQPAGCSGKGRADTDAACPPFHNSFSFLMTSLGKKHEQEPFLLSCLYTQACC